MRILAASSAFEMGLTFAIALSQPGNELEGKRALLMNIRGRLRKLTIAMRESIVLTERAMAVKRHESPNPRSPMAKNAPRNSRIPKLEVITSPSGIRSAMTNVSTPRNMAFTRFWATPEK